MKDIFWIKRNSGAQLAIVLCPPGGRGVQDELLAMKRGGIETLVSLLEPNEARLLGLSEEGRLAQQVGMQFLSYPIPDAQLPQSAPSFRCFIAGLAGHLSAGEAVGVHCRGSIGRATVTSACALIQLGWQPREALKAITSARGQAVPDTQEQEDWIMRYKPQPQPPSGSNDEFVCKDLKINKRGRVRQGLGTRNLALLDGWLGIF